MASICATSLMQIRKKEDVYRISVTTGLNWLFLSWLINPGGNRRDTTDSYCRYRDCHWRLIYHTDICTIDPGKVYNPILQPHHADALTEDLVLLKTTTSIEGIIMVYYQLVFHLHLHTGLFMKTQDLFNQDIVDLAPLTRRIEQVKKKYTFDTSQPELLKILVQHEIKNKEIKTLCDTIACNNGSGQQICNGYISTGEYLDTENLSDYAYYCYKQAAISDPHNSLVWIRLGDYYTNKNRLILAFICYLRTSDLAAVPRLATIMTQLGWPDVARKYLDSRKDAERSDNIKWHFARAMTYAKEEQYQQAIHETDGLMKEDLNTDILHKRVIWFAHEKRWEDINEVLPDILSKWDLTSVSLALRKSLFLDTDTKSPEERFVTSKLPSGGIQDLSEEEANIFLLTCLISNKQKKEAVTSRIKTFISQTGVSIPDLWKKIAEIPTAEWKKMKNSMPFHPVLSRHMNVHSVAVYLTNQGNGDARWIWTGVTRGEVLRRLLEAGCPDTVTNLFMSLVYQYPFVSSSEYVWSPDKAINRIVVRLIFGRGMDHVLLKSELYRQYFSETDDILHRIGTHFCLVRTPHCSTCPLYSTYRFHSVCTYAKASQFPENMLYSFFEEEDEDISDIGDTIRLMESGLEIPVTKEFKTAYIDFEMEETLNSLSDSKDPYRDLLDREPVFTIL